MEAFIYISQALTGLAFLAYGTACLCFGGMKAEFERYGLAPFRPWTGFLETLGGMGLWLGLYFPLLTLTASVGLAFVMVMGIFVRWRLRDIWMQMAPAAVPGAVNCLLFLHTLTKGF
ncbi:MAG: DoxX family protein [Opitutales bacterium]|nr:DoxX family protein [Opitutales bacterium]